MGAGKRLDLDLVLFVHCSELVSKPRHLLEAWKCRMHVLRELGFEKIVDGKEWERIRSSNLGTKRFAVNGVDHDETPGSGNHFGIGPDPVLTDG